MVVAQRPVESNRKRTRMLVNNRTVGPHDTSNLRRELASMNLTETRIQHRDPNRGAGCGERLQKQVRGHRLRAAPFGTVKNEAVARAVTAEVHQCRAELAQL